MNRTVTLEIRDIPDEVWTFLVNARGSDEAVDDLIRDMITVKATTALVLYYQLVQSAKAGVPLEAMMPMVMDTLSPELGDEDLEDAFSLELERKVSNIFRKIEEKNDGE